MKRKLIACLLALLLCLSLGACGAMRGGTGMNDRNTTNGTGMNDRNTTEGTGMDDRDTTSGSDMIPDTDDGVIRDGNAEDGIVDDEHPKSSPNVTRNP